MEQAAQIETTLSNLNMLDVDSDPPAAHFRLLEELGNLREARHKLRDHQDVALLTIAQYEKANGPNSQTVVQRRADRAS